jgi:hypothetical protein
MAAKGIRSKSPKPEMKKKEIRLVDTYNNYEIAKIKINASEYKCKAIFLRHNWKKGRALK